MKYFIILLFIPMLSVGQNKFKYDSIGVAKSGTVSKINFRNNTSTVTDSGYFSSAPTYKQTDTVPCLFLTVQDTDTVTTKWVSGFVVRSSGMVSFTNFRSAARVSPQFADRISVSAEYLPISSGIIQSPLLYKNHTVFTGMAIQIILLPNVNK